MSTTHSTSTVASTTHRVFLYRLEVFSKADDAVPFLRLQLVSDSDDPMRPFRQQGLTADQLWSQFPLRGFLSLQVTRKFACAYCGALDDRSFPQLMCVAPATPQVWDDKLDTLLWPSPCASRASLATALQIRVQCAPVSETFALFLEHSSPVHVSSPRVNKKQHTCRVHLFSRTGFERSSCFFCSDSVSQVRARRLRSASQAARADAAQGTRRGRACRRPPKRVHVLRSTLGVQKVWTLWSGCLLFASMPSR